ncbi:MAG: DUF1595 domain-containing protein, partial [Deltaproteobacteria bacterium]
MMLCRSTILSVTVLLGFALGLPQVTGCERGRQASLALKQGSVDEPNQSVFEDPNQPKSIPFVPQTFVHLPAVNACADSNAPTPAPRALRRLTQSEVNLSVSDLFAGAADVPQTTSLFNSDPVDYGFNAISSTLVLADNMAGVMMNFAETVGDYAMRNANKIASCSSNDDACRTMFVQSFGLQAFRMPLTVDQVQAYVALMGQQSSFNDGVRVVVSAMLQSPFFLYRQELGSKNAQGTYTLSPYEIASELSYFLTGSMPDAPLFAAAANNSLGSPAQIKAHAHHAAAQHRA